MAARKATDMVSRAMDVTSLCQTASPDTATKAGVLPFVRDSDGNFAFMLMKPHATVMYPNGPFQIAKGTRLVTCGTQSWDMGRTSAVAKGQTKCEPLLKTALREGREELGLKPSNIKRLFDMGSYVAESEITGEPRAIHMYAAEVKHPTNYFSRPESGTAEVKWFRLDDEGVGIKKGHLPIMQDIASKIEHHLASERSIRQK